MTVILFRRVQLQGQACRQQPPSGPSQPRLCSAEQSALISGERCARIEGVAVCDGLILRRTCTEDLLGEAEMRGSEFLFKRSRIDASTNPHAVTHTTERRDQTATRRKKALTAEFPDVVMLGISWSSMTFIFFTVYLHRHAWSRAHRRSSFLASWRFPVRVLLSIF